MVLQPHNHEQLDPLAMKVLSYVSVLAFSLSMPMLAVAAGINIDVLTPYSNGIIDLINKVFVPLLFAIAFLQFVYGVYKFLILGAENEAEREKGKQFVLWSLIAFAVIISVWGLVNVLVQTFNIPTGGQPPNYPTL